MKNNIFISYAGADQDRIQPLIKILEDQGWSVWWDRNIPPGKTFDEVIEEAIDGADCVIVIWSEKSVLSKWVRTEANEGDKRGVLIPVLIDNVKIPLAFRLIESAQLIDWDGISKHSELSNLLSSITRLIGKPSKTRDHTPKLSMETNTSTPNNTTQSNSAVVLCIDISGSMAGNPIKQTIKAASAFAKQKMVSGSMVGCTVFGSSSATVIPISEDISKVLSKLSTINVGYGSCGHGTNMEKGLKQSFSILHNNIMIFKKQIIVLSDGYTSGNVREQIPYCLDNSITIHTVGAGGGYDRSLLEDLALKTGGVFIPTDFNELEHAFLTLVEK